jgi:two-component system sensor histidine kinase KdpD
MIIGSVVDDVIRLSGAIDVYVITGDDSRNGKNGKSGSKKTSVSNDAGKPGKLSAYLWTLAILGICSAFAGLMRPYFELSNVVMIYLFGVVIIASQFGRGPSILASIVSVAAFDFFYVPPYLTFAVSDTQYILTFVVMLVVALFISTLTTTIKQQAEASWLRETRTTALYSMSRELSSSLDAKSLATIGVNHIASVFESQVALYLTDNDGLLGLAANGTGEHELKNVETGITSWVHQNKQPAGLGTDTLPGADALYLPLTGAKKIIGVLVVRPAQSDRFLSPEQFRLLETFSNQMALACERARMSEESEQARLQAKTEQLRSSLLSSFSHDLRTPLATISGAASSILEGSDAFDIDSCKQMVREIYQESMRMNRLVSNLLDMTKLQSGNLRINQELQPVDEVVGAAMNYMEEKIGERELTTNVPQDLPLINVDPVLIQQVLVNLIENAAKYSPVRTEIDVSAAQDGDEVIIAVSDRGFGIKPGDKEKIFEKFYRGDPQASTGAGLGLAICRGIAEAHGGRIWVEERPGGGSIFKFSVPAAGGLPEVDFDNDEPLE